MVDRSIDRLLIAAARLFCLSAFAANDGRQRQRHAAGGKAGQEGGHGGPRGSRGTALHCSHGKALFFLGEEPRSGFTFSVVLFPLTF